MWNKKTNLTKAIWLIDQKRTLQHSVRRAIGHRKFLKARFAQIKLTLINRQWYNTAMKLNAMNEPVF